MMNSKFLMMAALAVCGCANVSEEIPAAKEEMVELNFSVPCRGLTKLTGNLDEDTVEDLQIFVFGKDGQLQAYGHAESDEVTLTCSTGEKRIAAIVNAPQASQISNETQLKELVSSFSDNDVERYVMAGIEDKVIEKTGDVTIPVSRLICKVALKGVTNAFELPQHQALGFAVKSIFLTNAAEDRTYFSQSDPKGWRNKGVSNMGQIMAASGNLLHASIGAAKVQYGETFNCQDYLYCYPNPLKEGMEPTYLVIETILGTSTYFYPVALPSMQSNKCYNVSLTVCKPGSSSPDVPVQMADLKFEVDVQPWAENVSVDETI
jgi:hypothetical protein